MSDATLDIQKAADMLNVHPKTVLDLIKNGDLAAGKVGRAYVLMTRDVVNYVETIIIKQTAERMGVPQRSPKSRRQVAATQVGISA